MKQDVSKVREILCALFFYTEGGYNIGESIENTITLIDNAALIAMPHFDEIYLALSRTSNRYDDEYECIKGDGQIINSLNNNNLSFTFSFDYYLFNKSGKIFIDENEVPKDKYIISKGSTVITLSNSYLKTLTEGNHIITLKMNDKEAEAHFTIDSDSNSQTNEEIINPNTGDNIMHYILMLELSVIGLAGIWIYLKKKKIN